MLLYDDPLTFSPRRVRMFIAEKDMNVPRHIITVGKGEHKEESYRRIAPNSRVPVLVLDDGTAILETVAICRYLEGISPEPNLMGRNARETALIEMWQRRIEWELTMVMGLVFRNSHPAMATLERQCPEYAELQRPVALARLAELDADLEGSEFVAGERFTIADITAFTTIEYFSRLGRMPVPEELVNLARWREAIRARPSATA